MPAVSWPSRTSTWLAWIDAPPAPLAVDYVIEQLGYQRLTCGFDWMMIYVLMMRLMTTIMRYLWHGVLSCSRRSRRRHVSSRPVDFGPAQRFFEASRLPRSRTPPHPPARRVAGRRIKLARNRKRRTELSAGQCTFDTVETWGTRRLRDTTARERSRRSSTIGLLLILLMTVALLANRRIGEASNPGPPQWGFDMPELDYEPIEDDLDRLDGVVGQADLGWVEAGFDTDWVQASIPAEQAGHAVHEQPFPQAVDVMGDTADFDEDELVDMNGDLISGTRHRPWRDVPDDRLLLEGPLTQEEEEVVSAARSEAVRLPANLFEQLQSKDREDASKLYSKWKDVLDRAQANRAARQSPGGSKQKGLGAKDGKRADVDLQNEPTIEEEMEVDDDEHERAGSAIDGARTSPSAAQEHCASPSATSRDAFPPRRRARGRRQRGARRVEVWTLNSSGKPQLEGALRSASERKGAVVAVLNQEHHQTKDRLSDLQATARKIGWQAAVVDAVPGRGEGPSAGVSIITPKHVPAGLQEGEKVDRSPAGSPGRVAALWLQSVVPSGILALSVYFYHSEKGSHRNMSLLCRALEVAHAARSPWLIAADYQEEPDEFLKWAAGPVQGAGGRIVSANEPTHHPAAGAAKNLDFFIVCDKLCPLVEGARIVHEVAASPHRAVAIVFKKREKPLLQWQLKAPRAFPRVRPIGCQRRPVAPTASVDALSEAEATTDGRSQAASAAWCDLVTAIEIELCGVTDRFAGDSPDPKFCGRSQGAKYTKVPVMPSRAAGVWGEVDRKTHAMIWAENRLIEMARLANIAVAEITGKDCRHLQEEDMLQVIHDGGARAKDGDGLGTGLGIFQWRQWKRLVKKFTSPHCPIVEVLGGDVRWASVAKHVRTTKDNPAAAGRATAAAAKWVRHMIVSQKRLHRAARAKGWRIWQQEQIKKGAGAAHAFVKRETVQPDTLLEVKSFSTAAPADVVEADFTKWNEVWARLCQHSSAPWRDEGSGSTPGGELPTLEVATLRKASRSFRITALGLDRIGPWQYDWLSDELLRQIARFLHSLERFSIWPQELLEALVHLIPKSSGGRRPIGVLVSLMRIWERARRPLVQAWRETCPRDYQWMIKGRGANRAVWAQSVIEEAARQMGLASATVLVDLMKAFEQIILARVWSAGLRLGFPVQLLRLGLELCSARRRLVYRGAYSESFANTLSAVLAGSGLATDFMFLVLVGPLDELLARHRDLRIFVIADDIKLGVVGHETEVPRAMEDATRDCIELLEQGLHMQISRDHGGQPGKTVAMGSNRIVRGKLGPKLKLLGVNTARRVRNLGVDFSLGAGAGRRAVQLGRWATAQARASRARRLGTKLGPRVIVASAVPSVTYGASTSGMSDGLLAALRSLVAEAGGKMRWRSTTARLIMNGNDPGAKVVAQPVIDWAEAWWGGIVHREHMTAAWRLAVKTVGVSARPNLAVMGGAGTFVASLRRLGWLTPSPDSIITSKGEILYFGDGEPPDGAHAVDPRSLRRWVADEYEAVALARSRLATEINDLSGDGGYGREKENESSSPGHGQGVYYGATEFERRAAGIWRRPRFDLVNDMMVPWLWPIARVVRAAQRRGRHAAAASLRSCVEGGWWTQARLAAAGVADDPRCRCGDRIGTLWHRLGRCRLTEDLRRERCPAHVLKAGTIHVWDPLFSRGVPARPVVPPPPAPRIWWERRSEGAEYLATGRVYTDGAAQGWHWRAVRAGYAAVCYNDDGEQQWVMRGICGEPHASIARAELRAVLEVLAVAAPPLVVYSDSAFVVDGFTKGEKWTTRAAGEAADLWRIAWRRMDDIGGGIEVKKVKAHTTWVDVLRGRISRADRDGNAAADAAAKEALAAAKLASPAGRFNAYLARAITWARWILELASGWVQDTSGPEEEPEEKEEAPQKAGDQVSRSTLAHEVWRNAREEVCRRCGRTSSNAAPTASFKREACRGSAAGRLLAQHSRNKNEVWNRHYHSKQALMTRGYSLESKGVVPRAMIDEHRLAELVDEGQLRAFRTHLGLPHEGEQGHESHSSSSPALAAGAKREQQRLPQDAPRSVRQRIHDIERSIATGAAAASSSSSPSSSSTIGIGTSAMSNKRSRQEAIEEVTDELGAGTKRRAADADDVALEIGDDMEGQADISAVKGSEDEAQMQEMEMRTKSEDDVTVDDSGGHHLLQVGPLVFCTRCAGYALERVGARLHSACIPSSSRATKTRLDRMRRGMHPLTGKPIT